MLVAQRMQCQSRVRVCDTPQTDGACVGIDIKQAALAQWKASNGLAGLSGSAAPLENTDRFVVELETTRKRISTAAMQCVDWPVTFEKMHTLHVSNPSGDTYKSNATLYESLDTARTALQTSEDSTPRAQFVAHFKKTERTMSAGASYDDMDKIWQDLKQVLSTRMHAPLPACTHIHTPFSIGMRARQHARTSRGPTHADKRLGQHANLALTAPLSAGVSCRGATACHCRKAGRRRRMLQFLLYCLQRARCVAPRAYLNKHTHTLGPARTGSKPYALQTSADSPGCRRSIAARSALCMARAGTLRARYCAWRALTHCALGAVHGAR